MNEQGNELDAHDNVAQMLSALPRVEAPANFEFGVRAKIASGGRSRSPLIPFLKIAAPLALILLVTTFVFYYGTSPTADNSDVVQRPAIVEPPAASPLVVAAEAPAEIVSGPRVGDSLPVEPDRPTVEPIRVANSSPSVIRDRSTTARRIEGGSVDRTLESARTITAPGFESVSRGNENSSGAEISIREVLTTLGIAAVFSDGGWKINSAADGSLAHRSGIRAGDVIESIDDRQLAETTSFKGSFSGKMFRVRRDGKLITLELRN